MASRYHWVTGGVSIAGTIPSAAQNTSLVIPAGGIVKKFLTRNWSIAAQKQASSNVGLVRPYWVRQHVEFTAGPNINRAIYDSAKRVPTFWTAFEAVAIPVYDFQVSAGDVELAFSQQCSYGKSSGPSQTILFQTSFLAGSGTYAADLNSGTFQYNFAVLYYL
jgi:hypothetical protein